MLPGSGITSRHHVGMASKGKMWRRIAASCKKILDAGRAITKGQPRAFKTKIRKLVSQQAQCTPFGWGH
jgi:hypothetical protein